MKRGQIFILALMVLMVILLFAFVGVIGFAALSGEPEQPGSAENVALAPIDTPTITPTPTPIPTNTSTATPTDIAMPTPTATRVVITTPTPIPTRTPFRRPTPTNTLVVGVGAGSTGSSGVGSNTTAFSTAVPVQNTPSPYPFQVIAGPVEYETKNFFVTILTKLTANNSQYLAGYRMVGSHSPTGQYFEGVPSCDHICKASGPAGVFDSEGNKIETFLIQEGNLVYEFPYYEDGVLSVTVLDPRGQQVSDTFHIQLDRDSDERRWFFMHLNR